MHATAEAQQTADVTIWRYTGTPCNNGTSCPGWQQLDNNSHTVAIAAAGGNLYQRHDSGEIWRFTGVPCAQNGCLGWQLLDANAQTINIAADAANLYQLHRDGKIWRYTGIPCSSGSSCPGWQLLDNNSHTAQIAVGGGLYQMHLPFFMKNPDNLSGSKTMVRP